MGKVYIEETLQTGDAVTALTTGPYLIYSEILEGARRPLAFLQVVQENFDLVGKDGYRIQFLSATQLSASSSDEASINTTGMSATDKTLSAVYVDVDEQIWVATQVSDFLKEDFPSIDAIRLNFSNMGKALTEYLDALVYSTIAGATGTQVHSCDDFDYGEAIDALTKLKDADWMPDPVNSPFLIVSSGIAGGLLKDTTFVSTERYTTADVAKMVAGEIGKYAGMRVLETSLLKDADSAYIVFPSNAGYGPVVMVCWKRRGIKTVEEYEATKAYTYYNSSIRANALVVQPEGICKITITSSP